MGCFDRQEEAGLPLAVAAQWGGGCGSTPRQGDLIGFSVDLEDRTPQVVVNDNGQDRVLAYYEVRPVDGVFPEVFLDAVRLVDANYVFEPAKRLHEVLPVPPVRGGDDIPF